MLRLTLTSLLLIIALSAGNATNESAVNQRLERFLSETGTPGISIAIMDSSGSDPKLYSAGYADIGLKVPITEETVLPIGSITKLFTAVSVFMLVDEQKISLDDKISGWFSNYPKLDGISISELVNHTSGLRDFVTAPTFCENMARAYTEDELLSMTANLAHDFPHGTSYAYSNTGYLMLGVVIKNASKLSFNQFIRERIASPLGMPDTRVYSDSEIINNRATGYAFENGQLKNAVFASIQTPHASGNLISSPKSFVRLGKIFRTGNLLKPSSYQKICSPPTENEVRKLSKTIESDGNKLIRVCKWGIEWVKTEKSLWMLTKNGVFPGYSSIFIYSPEQGASIALSTNNENAVLALTLLGMELIDMK